MKNGRREMRCLSIFLVFFITLGNMSISADEVVDSRPANNDRKAIITVLSWYSPIGALNGNHAWKNDGFDYAYAKKTDGELNYPISTKLFMKTAPVVDSPEFNSLLRTSVDEELRTIKKTGFDVVAYDVLPLPRSEIYYDKKPNTNGFSLENSLEMWMELAQKYGIKIVLFADKLNRSADFPQGYILNADDWVYSLSSTVSRIGNHSAYYRINGRPVVLQFGSSSKDSKVISDYSNSFQGWKDIKNELLNNGINIYFVADIRPDDNIKEWSSSFEALHMFIPGSSTEILIGKQKEIETTIGNKLIWSVNAGYYSRKLGVSIKPDFSRIHNAYMSAIDSEARMINVMTWNDYEEDTDIGPSYRKGNSLLHVYKYYNEWFKSGKKPAIKNDILVVSYPSNINVGHAEHKIDHPVFYWANLKKPRKIFTSSGQVMVIKSGLSMGILDNMDEKRLTLSIDDASWDLKANRNSRTTRGLGDEYSYMTLLQ